MSEAGAAFLGGLAGLSTGAYTLTLTGSNLNTSVADANAIGQLGTAFHLGGFHLAVNGTVTGLSALTAAAKLIVTPNITDTFSEIATLTVGDGLLSGAITVNDSEAVTTTQAAAFLALLGGSGIPVASVNFGGHVESITDSQANIQSLTGSSAWTGNTSVHSDFYLVAADSVANLIDPSHTAALAAMNGTTSPATRRCWQRLPNPCSRWRTRSTSASAATRSRSRTRRPTCCWHRTRTARPWPRSGSFPATTR